MPPLYFLRSSIFFLFIVSLTVVSAQVKYVDPFIGTGGHGHTFPGATVPFGMVQLSPDTRVEGWDACAGYYYSDTTILGFSHTHLSGTGVADYGDILVLPTNLNTPVRTEPAHFQHSQEYASPGYYSVTLSQPNVQVELTATKRVGFHRYTFLDSRPANIVIDLVHGLGPDKVLESGIRVISDTEIIGFRRSEGWAKDERIFFCARFSQPFRSSGLVLDSSVWEKKGSISGKTVRFFARFGSQKGRPVLVKIGLSFSSFNGAKRNINSELPGWDFDEARKKATEAWEGELGKIQVEGGSKEQLTTFYTALYHTMIAPNVFSDVDGKYQGMDKRMVKQSNSDVYTVFSLWDTFRGEHPLLTIIDQKRTLDFVKSLISKYTESNVLPVWELAANETWCMIGYHSVPVIVDAYAKGIRDFDIQKAYEAMIHSSTLNQYGLDSYQLYGFIPGEKESESVSKTLEYAYDDWCIAQMAGWLKKDEDKEGYINRSQAYKNLFNPYTGFFQPRVNGSFVSPFDPTMVTFHYTEANPWQYNFFVPHNVNDMMALHGGKERFLEKLDSLFEMPSKLSGREQADISGLIGQYAQGNEPSHHTAYLYNYAGAPWKTQRLVRLIVDSLYKSAPDGLCGNDDCGQLSAWYVLSAMGFYQVCPGQPMYCLGSPSFGKVTINLENGKKFIIEGKGNSRNNKYIQSASLNGISYTKSFIEHSDIMEGGTLSLEMGDAPNKSWGSADEDSPHSLPMNPIIPAPFIVAQGKTFTDSMFVTINSLVQGVTIYFSDDGKIPTARSHIYQGPLLLKRSAVIRAFSMFGRSYGSREVKAEFIKRIPIGTIKLKTSFSSQYPGSGNDALIDGLHGADNFRLGEWQGYEGVNMDAIVDLKITKDIKSVALGCLQDNNSWIFFPKSVEISFSNDGVTFTGTTTIKNDVSPKVEGAQLKEFGKKFSGQKARYIRVNAKNIGTCPPWHVGKGSKAWLFVDEITIE